MSSTSKIRNLLSDPIKLISILQALAWGWLLKQYYQVTRPGRVKIGRRLRVYTRLYIRGPGRVEIGDNCSCNRIIFKEASIITHSPDAVVRIGNGNFLGGTQISCVKKVEIGNENLMANVLISDSDVIPHDNMEVTPEWLARMADGVRIGNKTWLGANSAVLKGVTLEDECVLGAGSVAMKSAESHSLLVGIPARKIKSTRDPA